MALEKLRLDGKVAIVTGGGTGLGKGMVLALAEAGADIVIAARRHGPIEATVEQVTAMGRRGVAIPTDITDSSQVDSTVEQVIAEFGKIDILINNAGGGGGAGSKTLFELTDADWRQGLDINLTGAFYFSRAAARHMVERQSGTIINVASGTGMRGARTNFVYHAAKAGTIVLTQSLALSLVEDNIRVHCIVPGFAAKDDPQSEEEWQRLRERGRFIPLGRLGYPAEFGPLAVYLASDAASYMTGQIVPMDGGGLVDSIAPIQLVPRVPL